MNRIINNSFDDDCLYQYLWNDQLEGAGIIDDGIGFVKNLSTKAYDTVDTFFNSRDSNPSIRKFIADHGKNEIKHITISREPLPRAITSLLHIITSGQSLKSLGRLGYDDLYHLALKLDLSDGSSYRFEKNETLKAVPWNKKPEAEYRNVPVTKPITVEQFYSNAYNYSKEHGIPFYRYNVVSANCQIFLNVCLTANSKYVDYSQADRDFVMQDVGAILESSPYLEKVVGHVTDLKDAINVAIYGKGHKSKNALK